MGKTNGPIQMRGDLSNSSMETDNPVNLSLSNGLAASKLASSSPAHDDRGLISIFRGLNHDVARSSMMTPDTGSKQNGWKETPEGSLIECRFRGRNISEQEKNPNEKHVPSILHLSENSNLFVRA